LTLVAAPITERVQADMAAAAKARDQSRLSALRLILDALNKAAKDARDGFDEEAELAVLRRERKRRSEAAEAFRNGGRPDQAEAEEAEAALIEAYLPAEISDAELEAIVDGALADTGAASPKEIGKVMAAAMPKVAGRADGKRVNELVRGKLGA
jgi:uncharacterized protein